MPGGPVLSVLRPPPPLSGALATMAPHTFTASTPPNGGRLVARKTLQCFRVLVPRSSLPAMGRTPSHVPLDPSSQSRQPPCQDRRSMGHPFTRKGHFVHSHMSEAML